MGLSQIGVSHLPERPASPLITNFYATFLHFSLSTPYSQGIPQPNHKAKQTSILVLDQIC